MKDSRGFTLIELMIVVAIIGILAAIAIPNFLRFQAKTKTAEATYNLKAIFNCEVSWYGENNSYDPNFDTIRWRPEGTIYFYTFSAGAATRGKVPTAVPVTTPVVTTSAFTIPAWGTITNSGAVDEWYINDANTLVHVVDGTR